MGAVGKELFAVRVSLPKDVTAVLLCDKSMNVEALTTKALSYLKVCLIFFKIMNILFIMFEKIFLMIFDLIFLRDFYL